RLLRDALSGIEEDRREDIGSALGQVVWVDGFRWEESKRVREKVHPAEAYQPKAIDKQSYSWPQAAADTSGLTWLDSRYAEAAPGSRATSDRAVPQQPTHTRRSDISTRYRRPGSPTLPASHGCRTSMISQDRRISWRSTLRITSWCISISLSVSHVRYGQTIN